MSIIAAMLVLYAAPSTTAEQVTAAHVAVTSIGPDPCRTPTENEIVVCARRVSPYSLPLYNPTDGDTESIAGGRRAEQMASIKESETACAKQGAFCYPPPAYNGGSVLRVLIKGATKLIEGE